MKNKAFILAAAVAALSFGATASQAAYPDRPITYIIPHTPSSSADVGVRTWLPYMEKCLGGTITPVTMPGGSTAIGIAHMKNSAPDGYTMGQTTLVNFNTAIIGKPGTPIWTLDDFEFLGNFIGSNGAMVVRNDSDITSVKDLIDRAKGGQNINLAITGTGGDDHLAALLMLKTSGAKLNIIPFGDGAEARNAILGGHADVGMMSTVEAARVKEQFHVLGVTAPQRIALFPDVPTMTEQGYPIVMGAQHVVAGPKGLPDEVKQKWSQCIVQVQTDPGFLADAAKRSISLQPMNAEQTTKFVHDMQGSLEELWKTDPWVK